MPAGKVTTVHQNLPLSTPSLFPAQREPGRPRLLRLYYPSVKRAL
jgi:hypothetical protein